MRENKRTSIGRSDPPFRSSAVAPGHSRNEDTVGARGAAGTSCVEALQWPQWTQNKRGRGNELLSTGSPCWASIWQQPAAGYFAVFVRRPA